MFVRHRLLRSKSTRLTYIRRINTAYISLFLDWVGTRRCSSRWHSRLFGSSAGGWQFHCTSPPLAKWQVHCLSESSNFSTSCCSRQGGYHSAHRTCPLLYPPRCVRPLSDRSLHSESITTVTNPRNHWRKSKARTYIQESWIRDCSHLQRSGVQRRARRPWERTCWYSEILTLAW